MKILLVEDNPIDVRLIRRMLEKDQQRPYELLECGELEEALHHLSGDDFDLILLDLSLPDSRGLTTYHRVMDKVQKTPVIIITGFEDEEFAAKAIKHGAQDYLVKGQFDRNLLQRSLRYAVERKKTAETLRERKALLNSIFEAAPIGIGIVRERVITWVNDRLCELTGYPARELIGSSSRVLYEDEAEFERVGRVKYGRIAVHGMGSIETRFRKKDGQVCDVLLSSAPIDRDDLSAGVVFTVMDISLRKQAEARAKRELAVTKALSRLYTPLVSPDSSIEDIAAHVLDQALEVTGCEHGYVATIDPVTRDLVAHTFTNMLNGECRIASEEARVVFPIGGDGTYPAMWGHVLNTGEPYLFNDINEQRISKNMPRGHIPITNFLSVPVKLGGQLVGQIALANKPGGFVDGDLEPVQRIGEFYGLAIQRMRYEEELKNLTISLEERVRQRTYQLEVASGLARTLSAALNYEELFTLMMNHLDQVVPYDVAASLFKVESDYQLYVQARCPLSDAAYDDIKKRMVEFMAGLGVARSRVRAKVIRASRLDAMSQCDTSGPIERFQSDIEVPLIVGEEREVGGLLYVTAKAKDKFTSGQKDLLRSMAAQAASTIERIRELIQAEKARLTSLLENLPLGVILLDAGNKVVEANPVAWDCLRELHPGGIESRLTHLGVKPLEELYRTPPKGMSRHEIVVEGPPRSFYLATAQEIEGGPLAGGSVLTVRDITEDKLIEERAKQQDRLAAVGQLAAGIAHDFNNLLSAIGGYGELILNDDQASETICQRAGIIKGQVDRAAYLIRQILDFSRKSIASLETLDLCSFMKETAKLLERTLPESIHVHLDIAPDLYLIKGDPVGLQQVVTNLAVNSQQAMPGGGELKMSLQRQTHAADASASKPETAWIILKVEDTGQGIPEQYMDQIFDPFFTTKMAGEGTGLGLSQVYGIVSQHKGFIEVDSKVGRGTTVSIIFPALPEKREDRRVHVEETPLGNRETVLLVEDEPLVLQMGSDLLESLNYRVISAQEGKEALSLLKKTDREIDLVITDMVMPRMGGMELIQAMQEAGLSIPVIIWTGYPLGKTREELASLSVADWIMKPPRRQDLAEKIHRALLGDRCGRIT